MKNWTKKTLYLRSLVERSPAKENLNPVRNVKERNFDSKVFLLDSDKKKQQVCLEFLTKVIQSSRSRVFRAIKSKEKNANATDRRGKFPTRKSNRRDVEFVKSFIAKFATYEASYIPNSINSRLLHPALNLRNMYSIYRNHCAFDGNVILSEQIFRRIFKTFALEFRKHLKVGCAKCKELNEQMQPKVQALK